MVCDHQQNAKNLEKEAVRQFGQELWPLIEMKNEKRSIPPKELSINDLIP